MARTRIKICGITRAEDALLAARCGADAVGMVFHPASARNVTIDQARKIVAVLPPFVTPVGLFVNAATETIISTARALRLRHLQLHGHEKPADVARLSAFAVIKAMHVNPLDFAEQLETWKDAIARFNLKHLTGFVLDTANTGQAGGSGVANDWDLIRSFKQAGGFENLPPVIAAGGLNPQNVGAVVRDIRPWAVDVSSGVESSKGVKSEQRVRAFIEAVHEADAGS